MIIEKLFLTFFKHFDSLLLAQIVNLSNDPVTYQLRSINYLDKNHISILILPLVFLFHILCIDHFGN